MAADADTQTNSEISNGFIYTSSMKVRLQLKLSTTGREWTP
jgi:hypothetical protein